MSAHLLDTGVMHPARRYNYWLGGKDHFAADRASGDAIAGKYPFIQTAALQNRAFLHRAVHHMTQLGLRQFLDLGTGIPVDPNTHNIAQQYAPDSRVVYVDNDPMVQVHAQAFLDHPAGNTRFLNADVTDPASILTSPAVRELLDLSQPVGLLFIATLHLINDAQAYPAARHLIQALAPGSIVAISHATGDYLDEATRQALAEYAAHDFVLRDRAACARFFDGLQLLEPGIQPITCWRPEPGLVMPEPAKASMYAALARVPQPGEQQ